MSTVAQAVRVLSKGKYTIGPEGTITNEDFSVLLDLLSSEITRRNPGFTGSELVRFQAYFVLDSLANSSGAGQVIEKTVKDVRWKTSTPNNSSQWMDYVDQMISEYSKPKACSMVPVGVARCDSTVKGFDNSTVKQYGSPSDAL